MVTIIGNKRLPDYIAMVIVLLMAVGTVFVFSAGANISREFDLHRFYDLSSLRQILFFPIACLIIYAISYFDYRRFRLTNGWLKSLTTYMLVLSIALLITVLIPSLGTEINRARRWLRIPVGPIVISFQPSELAKWATVFFLAAICDKFGDEIKIYWKRFVPVCVIIGVVVGLIIVEDFGTAAFISILALLMLIIAGVKWWHILTPLPFGAVGFLTVLIYSPSRM